MTSTKDLISLKRTEQEAVQTHIEGYKTELATKKTEYDSAITNVDKNRIHGEILACSDNLAASQDKLFTIINQLKDLELTYVEEEKSKLEAELRKASPATAEKNVLDKLVASLSSKPDRIDIKINAPVFKGVEKENPVPHVMRASDWMNIHNIPDIRKPEIFKLTLDGKARTWYDRTKIPATWDEMTKLFTTYFSLDGRSLAALHKKWNHMTFDADKEDIEDFIQEVVDTGTKIEMTEIQQVLHIRNQMPPDAYGVMFSCKTIEAVTEKARDYFATRNVDKKPEPAQQAFGQLSYQAYHNQRGYGNRGRGFKPSAYRSNRGYSRGRSRGYNRGRGSYRGNFRPNNQNQNQNQHQAQTNTNQTQHNNSYRGNNQGYRGRGNSRSRSQYRGNFRGSNRGRPRQTRDSERCFACNEFGHWAQECPNTEQPRAYMMNGHNEEESYEDFNQYGEECDYLNEFDGYEQEDFLSLNI